MKEESLLTKLRDTEHMQLVTDMRRRIAELELQVINQSLSTSLTKNQKQNLDWISK